MNAARLSDYYSPLPVLSELRRTQKQWNRPSRLSGIQLDLPAMRDRFSTLFQPYGSELAALPSYEQCVDTGFGPGFPLVDALTLYCMLRDLKPRRYLEIGSGLSTYYCSLAATANRIAGFPLDIHCIEPYPFPALCRIKGIRLTNRPVQEVPLAEFEELEAGDVLFIDSSHALKIGGDVAYLFLEVLPILQDGVYVHVHDVPFPYNIPYPAEFWVFGQNWPIYWNEALLVQAFLSFNERYVIRLSAPLIHHREPSLLPSVVPGYRPPAGAGWFSSLWLLKQPGIG